MKKRVLSVVLAVCMLALTASVMHVSAQQSKAEQYLASMTTEEKISQMLMPAFRYKTDGNGQKSAVTEITEDISNSVKNHSYAGVILFMENAQTNAGTVRLIDAMQQANLDGGDRPQLLIATDQEGGNVTRLVQGTMLPGNMALGAINDLEVTREVAAMMGSELSAVGINADFAPVVDVNNNPANPVIGVRSFSDDAQTVASHGSVFVEALNDSGIISSLKHFPGHGDTDTDTHSRMTIVNKSYDQLKQNELIPFKACIDAGAQMIMTAHIQYPQIETETYTSKLNGEQVYLPATLSKKIITDVLRTDMGFDGVVVTDALNMGAIADHFDRYDAAKFAINAGVDILLMPVDTSTKAGIDDLDAYISTLVQMAENKQISMDNINAAVLRILKLKEANGLFVPYNGSDLESRVENAVNNVGTKEKHDWEWNITKRGMTLVKNDNDTLPLTTPNQKTVVLTPYNDETIPMEYAVRRLRDEGKLPDGAVVEAYSYYKKTKEEVLPMINGADNVIFMSEVYSADALKGELAAAADLLADVVHARGGKFIVMSVSLPYDAARFQKADAIMLAYLPRSMPEDPLDKVKEIRQYGPNMPVAMYMMFSKEDAPTAKLPITIPKLDENNSFTDTALYPRGFGLTYEQEEEPTGEVTTAPDETVEGTTVPAAPATDAGSSTKDSATGDQPTIPYTGGGAVQTGAANIAILVVIALLGLSALVIMRYAKQRKE